MGDNIKYASQLEPFRVMKKHFKNKKDKEYIADIYKIIKKYNSNITDKEVILICSKISKGGCTYASMANAFMEQFDNISYLEEKLGYSLTNNDGVIEYDKLMVDLYVCISSMVELEVYKYDIYYYSSVKEAYEGIVGKSFENDINALNELNNLGIMMDGNSNDGKIIFKNVKVPKKQVFLGNYSEIAYNLFNINNLNVTKEELEILLKKNNLGYRFNNELDYSKFSGLGPVASNNIKKWVKKFFEVNHIDLELDVEIFNNYETYDKFSEEVILKLENDYYLFVSSNPNLEVWMTDGKTWEKPSNEKGHRMNFVGFDKDGNILLCSWGKIYMVPQEFYNKLEFISIKLNEKNNNKIR